MAIHVNVILTLATLFSMMNSIAFAETRNISAVVPNAVEFECERPARENHENATVSLLKDDTRLIDVILTNSSVIVNNEKFTVALFESTISIKLKHSSLEYEGKFRCLTTSNNTEKLGTEYSVKIFAKPIVELNVTSSIKIFVGETTYIRCNVTGKPKPSIQWWINNSIQVKTEKPELLIIHEAKMSQTGLYSCRADNTYGESFKNVPVIILDQFPGKPFIHVESQNESSISIAGQQPSYLGRGNVIKNLDLKYNRTVISKEVDSKTPVARWVITKLQPATKYTIFLTACNPFVCGQPREAVLKTTERGKPTKPTNLRVEMKGSRYIKISWNHGKHSGRVVRTNITHLETKGSMHKVVDVLSGADSQFMIKNLKPYSSYNIYVVTCVEGSDKVLCSDTSDTKSVNTEMAIPSSPRIISLENTRDAEIAVTLEWEPPRYANGPPVEYQVHYRIKTESKWNTNDVPDKIMRRRRIVRSLRPPYKLSNLLPLSVYEIKISAGNRAGKNDSAISTIKTDESAPREPRNLTLVAATATSLTIKWLPPLDPLPNVVVPIDCYHVSTTNNMKEIPLDVCGANANEIEILRLKGNTTYLVSLYASVRRKRDNFTLEGPFINDYFTTDIEQPPTEKGPGSSKSTGKTSLILATVICILVVIVVTLAALLYLKKKNIFDNNGRSVFYLEEEKSRPLASRLSQRSVERKSPAVSVADFPEHVARLHADSNYLFSEEFYSLGPSRPDFTWEHSTLHLNRSKNRYQDIVAYDHSRVRLMSMDGVPASNYINANFVDGFNKKNAYIATQAPLNQTIEDFWRMVWEQDVRLIVMLTNLMERGKRKCDQYWPHYGEITYGSITVRKVEERKYAFYVHRVFMVEWNDPDAAKALGYDNDPKLVRQFHFTDWPDFGVPQERSAMLSFVHMVRRYMQENNGPTIVHCSAGVGRSGTFIVIESQIERINRKNNVNVYGYLKGIRSQRNFLVQQEVQYIFIHDALMDYIRCGLTAVPIAELETIHDEYYFDLNPETGLSVIEEEWQIISEFSIHEFEMLTGKRPCNQQKNRDSFIIPVDASRVRLTMKGATEGTDYINANYVDSFLQKKAFIVTQMPLYDTIEDFWRMIWENFAQIVVDLLSDEECEMEDFLSYLPRKDCNPVNFGNFEIHCLSEIEEESYRLRELEVVGRVEWGESERRKIYHYQFRDWHETDFPKIDDVYDLILSVKVKKGLLKSKGSSECPIVVHCSCGSGRSGVYCALSNIKEQMDDFEETVDVFSIVRMLRRQRPLIINSKGSYEYLYRAALRYKELMPTYRSTNGQRDTLVDIPKSPMDFSEEVQKLINNMEEEDSASDVDI